MVNDRKLLLPLAGASLVLIGWLFIQPSPPAEARSPRIRRTILLNFKAEATPEQIQKILKEAATQIAGGKGVRNIFAGAQIHPQAQFKYGISMDFDDEAALKAYRANEEHRKIHNAYVHLIEGAQITDIRDE